MFHSSRTGDLVVLEMKIWKTTRTIFFVCQPKSFDKSSWHHMIMIKFAKSFVNRHRKLLHVAYVDEMSVFEAVVLVDLLNGCTVQCTSTSHNAFYAIASSAYTIHTQTYTYMGVNTISIHVDCAKGFKHAKAMSSLCWLMAKPFGCERIMSPNWMVSTHIYIVNGLLKVIDLYSHFSNEKQAMNFCFRYAYRITYQRKHRFVLKLIRQNQIRQMTNHHIYGVISNLLFDCIEFIVIQFQSM